MAYTPDYETFIDTYQKQQPQVLWKVKVSDTENPITASLKLRTAHQPFFLLESVENGKNRGRYSIIGLYPDLIWKCDGTKAYISNNGTEFIPDSVPVLTSFRNIYNQSKITLPSELPPMAAGLIGYLSYDIIRLTEPSIPDKNPDTINIPMGMFMRPTIMVIFDAIYAQFFVIASIYPTKQQDAHSAHQHATKTIDHIIHTLETKSLPAKSPSSSFTDNPTSSIQFTSNTSREEYHQMVEKAKEYIYDGDIFQVVPSQRFTADFNQSPFSFYRSLRNLNPAPFLFYLDFGTFQLTGSSPEILVQLKNNTVTIRPLAGTRKRGQTPQEDREIAQELLSDQKELSEHLMLIDLSRNDIGRIAKTGTVKLTEKMIIEYYSHVMHICSNVEGQLRSHYDALDALLSGLPVGTVSGAPKIRAMQIIDELEKEKRSFYAGCVGYFSANGDMETCITLRTALIKEGKIYVQAGGGIVAESDPEAEYQESCNKAQALITAAQHAHYFIS